MYAVTVIRNGRKAAAIFGTAERACTFAVQEAAPEQPNNTHSQEISSFFAIGFKSRLSLRPPLPLAGCLLNPLYGPTRAADHGCNALVAVGKRMACTGSESFMPSRWAGAHPMGPHIQLQMQHMKHTLTGYPLATKFIPAGGPAVKEVPRKRRPRFKSSPKIMNTATLRELGDLAKVEIGGWKPKELAAAARRAVVLWRLEQPEAASHVRMMQRLSLGLPPSSSPSYGRVMANGGGSRDGNRHSPGRAVRSYKRSNTASKSRASPTAKGVQASAAEANRSTGGTLIAASAAAPESLLVNTRIQPIVVSRPRLSRGVYSTKIKEPYELLHAQLVQRLVHAASGRLAEGFGSRELSSLVWSLVSLGYWQQPLLPLVSAFADYGAERLREADPITMAMLLQVLSKARAAAARGKSSAARLLDLAPTTAAAAAASLPRCLPSCEHRTLAGLLDSCAVLLNPASPARDRRADTEATMAPDFSKAEFMTAMNSGGRMVGGAHLDERTTNDLAALAREVIKECLRRRFMGFGSVSLVTAAGALAAFHLNPTLSHGRIGGDKVAAAWGALSSAAVSPAAPQMAGAASEQWELLLRVARVCHWPSQELEAARAGTLGALATPSL